MNQNLLYPNKIAGSAQELKIEWSDGTTKSWPSFDLRVACFCAHCVSEITGERTLNINNIAPSIEIIGAAPVGNYGLALKFSDGHDTGIYSYEFLQKI